MVHEYENKIHMRGKSLLNRAVSRCKEVSAGVLLAKSSEGEVKVK